MPVPTGVRVALGVFCGEAFERVLDDLGLERDVNGILGMGLRHSGHIPALGLPHAMSAGLPKLAIKDYGHGPPGFHESDHPLADNLV